ncbi:MAG: hypothetical protein M3384_07455 [Acidobacteriota bacterium]|nr:hypothetical protein [Acidobacteriota bacterium]
MSSVDSQKIYTILIELYSMQHGDAQIALAEEAVRLADLNGDLKLQFRARSELIRAAVHGGESEKAIVAYSWCLKKYDENPDSFSEYLLFWQYKWILNNIHHFPAVSRAQIDSIFADAVRRYRQNNISLRPIYGELCSLELSSGNFEEANEYYRKWLTENRDLYADCLACETNRRVEYLASSGRDEEALKMAEPILNGDRVCSEIPHLTLGSVLLPLLRMNQVDVASECFTKGYKLVSGNKDFLLTVAQQIQFLALIGKTRKGTRLFEKHLSWALETKDLYSKFQFYKAVCLLLNVIEREKIKLVLPNSCKDFNDGGVYETETLRRSFLQESEEMARLFDKRNGNSFFIGQLREIDKLKENFEFLRSGKPGSSVVESEEAV